MLTPLETQMRDPTPWHYSSDRERRARVVTLPPYTDANGHSFRRRAYVQYQWLMPCSCPKCGCGNYWAGDFYSDPNRARERMRGLGIRYSVEETRKVIPLEWRALIAHREAGGR